MQVKNLWKPGHAGRGPILLSYLYGGAVRLRLLTYRLGIFRIKKIEGIKVIGVGNLTVGGSGKTPVTIMIARMLKESNYSVAMVSRGYGRKSAEPVQIVSDGSRTLASYPDAADEALLCANELKGVPVICAPKRTSGILAARKLFGARAAVLDDAFSHLSAWRDINILLVDALNPYGGGRLLPAGGLREPLTSAARADAVIIARAGEVSPEKLKEVESGILRAAGRGIPLYHCEILPCDVTDPYGAAHDPANYLKGKRVKLLSGIAVPARFEESVKTLGGDVEKHLAFEDHHRFTDEEIRDFMDDSDGFISLTTSKDYARLPSFARSAFCVLNVRAKIREEEFPSFKALVAPDNRRGASA